MKEVCVCRRPPCVVGTECLVFHDMPEKLGSRAILDRHSAPVTAWGELTRARPRNRHFPRVRFVGVGENVSDLIKLFLALGNVVLLKSLRWAVDSS